jgi:hypothetical protein
MNQAFDSNKFQYMAEHPPPPPKEDANVSGSAMNLICILSRQVRKQKRSWELEWFGIWRKILKENNTLFILTDISDVYPSWKSRYSEWLRAGQRRGRSSSPGGDKNSHFSISSRPALGPTQHPIQWILGLFLRK